MISKHFFKFDASSILVAKDKIIFSSFETLENKGFRRCWLASIKGFEPSAYRLGGDRSIQLSYMDVCNFVMFLSYLWTNIELQS